MARLWKSGWVDGLEGDGLPGKSSGGAAESYWTNLLLMGPALPSSPALNESPPEMAEVQVFLLPKDLENVK